MGLLIDGIWRDQWYDTARTGGAFVRQDSRFRAAVTADGGADHPAAAGRYHLYVSLACPWAHRTLIYRRLKGLEDLISVTVVEPLMGAEGWTIAPGADPVNGARRLHEVYTKAEPRYTGRVTVPVLWDKVRAAIVNNESAEIIRMFDRAFDAVGASGPVFCPDDVRAEIDQINAQVYATVNNGVYRAGFATAQTPYEEAVVALFETLDQLDARLATRRYLLGDRVTEADWRLFTTLVRFDAVYVGHFKCNLRQIADYPHLSGYLRDLYQVPGVADTVDFDQIKQHYYASHRTINPTGIVPLGPVQDLSAPHDRARSAS